jgi:cell division protein FtsW (lipid II flippase)
MIYRSGKLMKVKAINFIPLSIAIPAVAIGVIAMYYNKVPTSIWAQNAAYLVIAGLISGFVVSRKPKVREGKFYNISILISILFLILTFISAGMEGVHRWVSTGIISFNISMIVLPIVIISTWRLLQANELWVAVITMLAVSILIFFQPDASQLTGFAIPMMVMLYNKLDKKLLRLFILGILALLIILSWVFLDNLPAVAYVEGIVGLLANMGLLWLVLGVISLIILPVPFILFPPKNLKLPSICLGLYVIIILISTLFGNFPVPLMGYGISPIIGYFIAITWYARAKANSYL